MRVVLERQQAHNPQMVKERYLKFISAVDQQARPQRVSAGFRSRLGRGSVDTYFSEHVRQSTGVCASEHKPDHKCNLASDVIKRPLSGHTHNIFAFSEHALRLSSHLHQAKYPKQSLTNVMRGSLVPFVVAHLGSSPIFSRT